MALRCTPLVWIGVLFILHGGAHALSTDEDDQIVALLDDDIDDSAVTSHADSIAMDQEAGFHHFIETHRKKYSKHEYSKRFEVYKDNLEFVRKFNGEAHGFKVAMNELADLTDDEYASVYLNPKLEEDYLASSTYRTSVAVRSRASRQLLQEEEDETEGGKYDVRWHKNTGTQPDEQDWSKKGVLSAVDNQAKCFACYAFAACGAIEATVHINGGDLVKLSAQQIVDCSDEYSNHRCAGGTMVKSYKYIADNGLMRDHDYKYNTLLNSRAQCKQVSSECKYNSAQTQQRVEGYVNVMQGNERDIMNAVGTRPVSAAIDAHHRPFKLYSSGVFSLAACTSHLTHGLLIVGYGTEDGRPYWKVKNSWGSSWGNGGFGKVSRGNNMCSIADWVNYPMVDKEDASKVSAVATLRQLGDEQEGIQDEPEVPAPAEHEDDYSYSANAGFETPWNAMRLEEDASTTSDDNSDKAK